MTERRSKVFKQVRLSPKRDDAQLTVNYKPDRECHSLGEISEDGVYTIQVYSGDWGVTYEYGWTPGMQKLVDEYGEGKAVEIAKVLEWPE